MVATTHAVEMISIEEIRDLQWPTDTTLVASFRKTIQSGGQIPLILVNRVWHDDATWHYEIIDGFHRYEAVKLEELSTILSQIVEYDVETARYNRALACLGKPAEVTRERAILALKEAFISEVIEKLGKDPIIYEPILGGDGFITKRQRNDPLPSEPFDVLLVITDHLMVRERVDSDVPTKSAASSFATMWKSWEKQVITWLDRMMSAFGLSRDWLRKEVLRHIEFGQTDSSSRTWLTWDFIPDVDIRQIIIEKLRNEAHPSAELISDFARYSGLASTKGPDHGLVNGPHPNKSAIIRRIKHSASLYALIQELKRESDALQESQKEEYRREAIREERAAHAKKEAEWAERQRDAAENSLIASRVMSDDEFALSRGWMNSYMKALETSEWNRRRNDFPEYMVALQNDPSLLRSAQLEILRCIISSSTEPGVRFSRFDLQKHHWEFGPGAPLPAEEPSVSDPTPKIVTPAKRSPSMRLAPLPVNTILQQCRSRYRSIDRDLEELRHLQSSLTAHMLFLREMLSQAKQESEKDEISHRIAKIVAVIRT